MSDYSIEEIENKTRSKKLQDRWQEYFDQLDSLLEQGGDPFESDLARKVSSLSHHLHFQQAKESSKKVRDIIASHLIPSLTETQKPGAKEIMPVVTQLTSALAAAAFGIAPIATGASTAAQKSGKIICDAINGFGASGSQAVGGLFSSEKQGKLTQMNYEAEVAKQTHEEILMSQRQDRENQKREAEEAARNEAQRHETFRAFTN